MSDGNQYIPALRYGFLTRFYDPLLYYGMREDTFKRRLLDEARIAPGFRVLDLGCGTGTLTVLVKQLHPNAQVVGIDGDQNVLSIARAKSAQAGADIQFEQGMAFQLPYAENSFDRVLSSLMIHHLTAEDKIRAFGEALRVLRPGGELWVVDFGKPRTRLAGALSLVMRRMERTEDNIKGLVPDMQRRAGLTNVEIVEQFMTLFGTITLYRARKPLTINTHTA